MHQNTFKSLLNHFFIIVFCFRQQPFYSTELNSMSEIKSCQCRAAFELQLSKLSTAVARRLKQAMTLYNPHFFICDFRNFNRPTPLRANQHQYTAERGEYMGLSSNMTVRHKMRPNKMALWNEFLKSLGETVKPTTRSDVLTTTRKPDDKKGITIECKYTKFTACISFDCMCFFFSSLFYFQSNYKSDKVHRV